MMNILNSIIIRANSGERRISLCSGNLAELPPSEAVDLLVVSAFPDDYEPTATSLIGALDRRGISVAELARNKEVDLRQFASCWLSRPIGQPSAGFQRILCFEPRYRGRAPEVVGDVFRTIFPIVTTNPPMSRVAMPLLAAGDQGESAEVMLEALVDAAAHWLTNGLPLAEIVIAVPEEMVPRLSETFARYKRRMEAQDRESPAATTFDLFVSYSHRNKAETGILVGQLKNLRPTLNLFIDQLELHPGAAWQRHIYEALEKSRKVLCLFSPDYLASKVCVEEYNIAHARNREADGTVLIPLYLYSAPLPTYMTIWNHIDVREADEAKLATAADQIVMQLRE